MVKMDERTHSLMLRGGFEYDKKKDRYFMRGEAEWDVEKRIEKGRRQYAVPSKTLEEFAEQDADEKAKVQARNDLEAYLYNLKNSVVGDGALEGKISDDDRASLIAAADGALEWMEDHPAAEKEEYDDKQKEVERIANPILKRAYESAGGGGGSNVDDDDFLGEDLDGVNDDGPTVEEMD